MTITGWRSLDPSGVLTKHIDPSRIIGCVVYPAAAATAPGVIHHVEGDRFPIGELDGKETAARQGIARRLHQGRAEIPGAAGYPFGDLAEGVGQSVVQPDLGTDPRHAGRHLPVRRDPRTGGDHDEGSAGHRAKTRRHLPRHHRQTASPARKRSARTRHQCCRTWRPADRSKPRR